jgi:hypothetical protein
MLVPYKVQPDQYGSFIYTVTLGVNLALPKPNAPRTKRFEAIIDSGASRCLFHASIATYLGLAIKSGVMENCNGIGGQQRTWVHDVALYIPGGTVVIKAGFTETLPVAGLLGMNGFFEHFSITFDPAKLECELKRAFRN